MAQGSVTLSLPREAILALKGGKRKTAVRLTLKSHDREDSSLAGFLQGFCTNVRESYVHESLTVDHVAPESQSRGTVEISFMGDAYMGCSEADYQHDRNETLRYRLDAATGEMELTAEFPDERSTEGEF